MTICIFLGPTLPLADARAILPGATYLPPARRGDVLAAVHAHDPAAIALIDGYFEQVPSVWHKELLWALDRGIAVYGAASMGALRAAELSQFGMAGVGRIHRAYAEGRFDPFDGPFEDDDEVAVTHGPAEIGYPSSDAMVDIRATLAAAREAGVIDAATMQGVAGVAKAIFYKRRTWKAVFERAALTESVRNDLRAWVAGNGVSQKRLDARDLLRQLAGRGAAPAIPPFRFERTLLWEQAVSDAVQGADTAQEKGP